jgi:hypothetical protein
MTELTKLNPRELGALVRAGNKTLMVHWINQDLFFRADNDVRTSIVFYDDARMFAYAFPKMTEQSRELLFAAPEFADFVTELGIRYWSKGV